VHPICAIIPEERRGIRRGSVNERESHQLICRQGRDGWRESVVE